MAEQLLELDEGKFGHSGGSGIVASIENVARRAVALVSRQSSHRKSQVIQSLARLLLPNTRGREGNRQQQCSPILNPSFPFKVGLSLGLARWLILFGCWFYFSTTVARQSRPRLVNSR